MSVRKLNWLKFTGLVGLAFALGLLFAGLLNLPGTSLAQGGGRSNTPAQLASQRNVSNSDVPGARALVKFTAYDFSIYGGLEGSVDLIGADSITDERGNTFYMVRVRTQKSQLGPNMPVIPGMVAEVDIQTGQKTILQYLLKPVLKARQAALTER